MLMGIGSLDSGHTMVDFLVGISELSRISRVRHYEAKYVKTSAVWRGWVTLSQNFPQNGSSLSNLFHFSEN